jgi:hypothetical protein
MCRVAREGGGSSLAMPYSPNHIVVVVVVVVLVVVLMILCLCRQLKNMKAARGFEESGMILTPSTRVGLRTGLHNTTHFYYRITKSLQQCAHPKCTAYS